MADDLAAWLTRIWDEQEKAAREWQAEIEAEIVIPARMLGGIVDPWRELARIAADRQILALHAPLSDYCNTCGGDWPCLTLRLLALPYADRPGYQEARRPE